MSDNMELGPQELAAVNAILETVKKRAAPVIKEASDELYRRVMEAAQDHLQDDAEYNILSRLSSAARDVQRNRDLSRRLAKALEDLMDGIGRQTFASEFFKSVGISEERGHEIVALIVEARHHPL